MKALWRPFELSILRSVVQINSISYILTVTNSTQASWRKYCEALVQFWAPKRLADVIVLLCEPTAVQVCFSKLKNSMM